MTFCSILFETSEYHGDMTPMEPDFFADLNLGQIVSEITGSRDEYNLKPFFYAPLSSVGAIKYRQEVMQDIENASLMATITQFSMAMRRIRSNLKFHDKLDYKHNREGVFIDTVKIYCDAVDRLAGGISSQNLKSRGFVLLREYLLQLVRSEHFRELKKETERTRTELAGVRYSMHIRTGQIVVRRDESNDDYSRDVLRTFEKFRQGEVKNYTRALSGGNTINHVEAAVAGMVAKLFPDVFRHLEEYCVKFADFLDGAIAEFDREVQFYIAYLKYIDVFRREGLRFCYPEVRNDCKNVYGEDCFDMALAANTIREKRELVCNDFGLEDRERIFVITGPNQGGKTTFARSFGQMHFLASLGCMVPGRRARLFLYDRLFTHFQREEDMSNLRGSLENDLIGMHAILRQASSNSIVIINEMFSSTTVRDGVMLGRRILGRIAELDMLCVCVTFLDELASLNKTVSLVSTVDERNPEIRTFKIIRRPADGLSYALAIARKYGLTYDLLMERMQP